MPSVSKKQHNLMEAVAHSPSFAKKVGIKQSVGKEFASADKGKKFKEGGMAESKKMVKKEVSFMKKKGAPKSMIKHEMAEMGMKRGGMPKKMAGGGMTSMGKAAKTASPKSNYLEQRSKRIAEQEESGREYGREEGRNRQSEADRLGGILGTPAAYLKRAGQYVGDKVTDADAFLSEKLGMQERAASRRGERKGLQEEGYKKGGMAKAKKMASGGMTSMGKVRTAAPSRDGIAKKGKTQGKVIKMNRGGKC